MIRTALVVTALRVEHLAARAYLTNVGEVIHEQGTVYEVGTFAAESGNWQVVLIEAGMGNVTAGIETERAIARFKPVVAFFVGVAGGLKDVDIGDVVVAESVYGYESGKVADDFLPRGSVGLSSYRLVQRARAEARKDNWLAFIKSHAAERPKVLVGKIAAGEKVVVNAKSDTRKMLQRLYSDALAVEMEGRGFLAAAYANENVYSVVIRGISDLLDNKTAADAAGSQMIAAAHGAAFGFNLLANLGDLGSYGDGDGEDNARAVAADRYRTWITDRTATFYVPALHIDVPSTDAFATLVVRAEEEENDVDDENDERPTSHSVASFQEELTRYHEAVTRSTRREIHATDLLLRRRHVTIVGGPAAGKSTLAKLLAYSATRNGKIAFVVSLKRVLARQPNDSFDAALRRAATIETGIVGADMLSPDLLICDGLDECDPWRADIARDLVAWARDHPSSRVVVMTRRLGHHSSLLPGFVEGDLPHLDQEADDLAKRLINVAVGKESERAELAKRVSLVFAADDSVSGIAHRNPLLLSFVIRLIRDGTPVGARRVNLYEQIVEVIRTSGSAGRESVKIEAASALRVAELLAFATIENPQRSSSQLIRAVAAGLTGAATPDAAEQRVETALQFWEEQRLVERIRFGTTESFTFIHLSFAEYLASAQIAAMTSSDLMTWIGNANRLPKWREPLLFAAGRGNVQRYVRALLEVVDCFDAIETTPLLAVDLIVEASDTPNDVIPDLVAALSLRLESHLRSAALESAEALAKLAPFAAAEIGHSIASLRSHKYLWTRISAIAFCAIAGDRTITPGEARAFFDAFHCPPPVHRKGMLMISSADLPRAEDLWRAAVGSLTGILLRADNSSVTREYLANRVFEDASGQSLRDVEHVIAEFGDTAWFTEHLVKWRERWSKVNFWPTYPDLEKNLLSWLLEAFGFEAAGEVSPGSSSYPLIAQLYSALELMRYPVGELLNFAHTPATPSVREVFKGVLAVLAINAEDMAAELRQAVAHVQRDDHLPFLELADAIEAPVDWKRLPHVDLDSQLLVEGLSNRRLAIMGAAAHLLAHAAWSPDRIPDLAALLNSPSRSTVRAAAWVLAMTAPLRAAFDAFLSRLAGDSTGGCGDVYEFLAELYLRSDESMRHKIVDRLFGGLFDRHSYAARGAARAIRSLHLPSENSRNDELKAAFSEWQQREIRCHECDRVTTKNHCEKCGYVLKLPLAPILRELATRGIEPSLVELVNLFNSTWNDLARAAKDVVRDKLAADSEMLQATVTAIGNDDSSLFPVLPIVLRLEVETLTPVKNLLMRIARGGQHFDEFLGVADSTWMSPTEAESIARLALDGSNATAEKALTVLRKLKAR